MAPSRSPSPSKASSPPGTPLTPQSKIRALLATVDSSSDEEPRPRAKKAASPKQHARTESPAQSTHSSSDGDEDILRPRGKLAVRMLAESNARRQSPSKLKEDARERVKRLLRAETESNSPTKNTAEDGPVADEEDQDEDEVVTARPRKLKPRRQRSTTPESADLVTARSPGLFVSPSPARSTSPGLFVSPQKPASPSAHSGAAGSDSDADLPSIKSDRFAAMLARKRKEQLAREAEEAKKKAARLAAQQAAQDDMMSDEGDESNITDDDGGRRLTQDARPARKASKKALEEMNRETQRLSRNLQLAHEAKTKKKIAKSTLFERFNFKPQGDVAENKPPPSSSRPTSPVSPDPIDNTMGDADTPPSSPPSVGKGSDLEKLGQAMQGNLMTTDSSELLTAPVSLEAATAKGLDKGKGKAIVVDLEDQTKPLPKVKRSVRVKLPTVHANLVTLGSDDELDVQPARKTRIDAIFARAPSSKTNESRSLHALRLLAQVNDPEKRGATGKNAKPGMTSGELEIDLQQRARQQAKLERDRRLELLKAKGIHVQTQEEREQEMAEVEDIVARARAEAEEIMTREREAAKKEKREKRAAGELDPLAWDDSDSDDEYEEGQEEEVEELELSGSEDEHEDAEMKSDEEVEDEVDDEVDDGEAGDAPVTGFLFDGEAESTGESEDGGPDELDGAVDSDAEDVPAPNKPGRRPKKHVTIISDDESDDPVEATPRPKTAYPKSPSAPKTVSPKVPTSVLRSATKTFIPGLPVAGPAGLGLTQIFAGTMDDSQLDPGCASPSQMMPSFNQFPDSNFSQSVREPAEDMMILDSQPTQNAITQDRETQGIQIRFSQSQMHGFDSLLQDNNATQLSEFIEPTQDEGFRKFTPLKQRFVEPPMSTMSTVALGSLPEEMPIDSPLVQRAGKLRRRSEKAAVPAGPSEDEAEAMEELDGDEFGFGTTAFSVMKDAAAKEKKKKAKEAFDKKKSKAREIVDEQAEESEDEYAGLGGADGEASSDDDAASVHEMIDDETKGNEADSAKLAAFYADRERASDEKQVDKLFRDITSGMLRRKRGGDYDGLSDSDDGGEARRRMKRRQFAKMQKALFADERVSKVAENPRNMAFLRTIEDLGSDDDDAMAFILEPAAAPTAVGASQESAAIPDSQPGAAAAAAAGQVGERRPAPQRRSGREGKKPANIGQIRESLSNLLEDPNASSVIPASDLAFDSDADAEDEDGGDHHPRRQGSSDKENHNPRRHAVAVVDRLTLKRNASSISTSSSSTNNNNNSDTVSNGRRRPAFAAPSSSSSANAFKVPALLRRATTNSLTSGSTSTSAGAGEEAATKVRKVGGGASRRSGVNYFAREGERRAAVAQREKRREERRWKGAEGRGSVVGGLFGMGKFE